LTSLLTVSFDGIGDFQDEVFSVRVLLILICCSCIVSCVSNFDRGVAHADKKEYDKAAHYWYPLAKQGRPAAQHNIALLWEYGLGSTPQNKEQAAKWYLAAAKQGVVASMIKIAEYQPSRTAAISWYNLAARWGNRDAIMSLRTLKEPIPRADLSEKQIAENQRKKKEQALAAERVLGALIDTVVAACAGSKNSDHSYPAIGPSFDASDSSCSSDYSCGIGYSCFKEPFENSGVCLKSVDSHGAPTYKAPDPNSTGIKTAGSCMFRSDCPIGFRCDDSLKACVK
jgi:Sel1 repeat